jgi:hypothetical protein
MAGVVEELCHLNFWGFFRKFFRTVPCMSKLTSPLGLVQVSQHGTKTERGLTVIGGLIVLGMFHQQWNIFHCNRAFESLALRCFNKDSKLLGHIRTIIRYLFYDALYDESILEKALKEVFGNSRKLFDFVPNTISGTRVALTAMSHDTRAIFTNYNGPSLQMAGYTLIRPKDTKQEPFVWQM